MTTKRNCARRFQVLQRSPYGVRGAPTIPQRAFPNHQDRPAASIKRAPNAPIATFVATQLLLPVSTIRPRQTRSAAVHMPPAPVHKQHGSEPLQNEVRASGQVLGLRPEPQA